VDAEATRGAGGVLGAAWDVVATRGTTKVSEAGGEGVVQGLAV
jgi:hypothetical protein